MNNNNILLLIQTITKCNEKYNDKMVFIYLKMNHYPSCRNMASLEQQTIQLGILIFQQSQHMR